MTEYWKTSVIAESQIQVFQQEELAVDAYNQQADSLHFSSGLEISVALIALMKLLEDDGGSRVSSPEVNPDKMNSISRIRNFLELEETGAVLQ